MSSVLVYDLASKLDKLKDEMEVLICYFLRLGIWKEKRVEVRTMLKSPSWDPKTWNPWGRLREGRRKEHHESNRKYSEGLIFNRKRGKNL